MRIAFVGKGGSGKTTLSALFSQYLAAQGMPVIAIDADINQHLATSLGMSQAEAESIPPLGLEIDRVKEFLKGDNPLIQSTSSMIKTTPPGRGSRLMKVAESNPLYDYFERSIRGIRLLATGPFSEEDLGIKCYHSKVGAVELFLNHLIDNENEYVVIDMTAGADSFASGLFTRFDLTILVTEPTAKGIGVYEQYKEYAENFGVNIKVVGNKIKSEDDSIYLQTRIGDDLLSTIRDSDAIRTFEREGWVSFAQLEKVNQKALGEIQSELDKCQKDWQKFYEQAAYFHKKNAESWANIAVGQDVTLQIDPDFSLAL